MDYNTLSVLLNLINGYRSCNGKERRVPDYFFRLCNANDL